MCKFKNNNQRIIKTLLEYYIYNPFYSKIGLKYSEEISYILEENKIILSINRDRFGSYLAKHIYEKLNNDEWKISKTYVYSLGYTENIIEDYDNTNNCKKRKLY